MKSPQSVTFAEYVESWRPYMRRTVSPETGDQYDVVVDRYLLPKFGPMPLASITRPDVVKAVRAWLEQPLKANTVKGAISVLGRIFRDAIDTGDCTANPARDVARPLKTLKGRGQPIEDHLMPELLTGLRMRRADIADLVAFLTQTGLRIGEALGIQWTDIGPETVTIARTWHSRRHRSGPPKGRRVRTVHLTDAARAILASRPKVSQWVWPNPRRPERPISSHTVEANIREVRKRLDLPEHVKPHSLRHSYGTKLIQADVNPRFVQQQMGHQSDLMTRYYSQRAVVPAPPHLDDALRLGVRPVTRQPPTDDRKAAGGSPRGRVIRGPWRRPR